LLLHVVDAAHPDWEEQIDVVNAVLADLGLAERPQLLVFNKIDAVPDPLAFAARVRELHPGSVTSTVMRTDGVQQLKTALTERASALRPTVQVEVPMTDGARIAALYRAGEVVSREDRGDRVVLTIRTEPWRAEQLRDPGGNGRGHA